MSLLKGLIVFIIFIITMSHPCWAAVIQQEQIDVPAGAAKKLDEYLYGRGGAGRAWSECDVDARLANLAYYLKAEPSARGYLISYKGKRRSPKYYAYTPAWQYHHLIYGYGIEQDRVVMIDGGYREEAGMELWIVPTGAEVPNPSPAMPQRGRKKS